MTRILVIAIVAISLFLGLDIDTPAQSTWRLSQECLDLPAADKACPVYDGKVNLKPPPYVIQKSVEASNQALDDVQVIQLHTTGGFNWSDAIAQSTLFLAICHGFRFATEPGTRAGLKGPFFKDYWASVRSLRGWADGDPFLVNYIGHPMGGSVAGRIQIQNDPQGLEQQVGLHNKKYWRSRLRAMAWSAAYSTQFEIGPFSEASLGNVGLKQKEKSPHPMAWVDLVVTPTMGTGWLVGEDLLDRYLIRWIESRIKNRKMIIIVRTFLNPTRSFANMHRGDWWWKRDDRP